MAAPTATARGPVGGTRLDNGYQALFSISSNITIEIYEKTITPPAIDGGDPIMTDTMLNEVYITKAPQCLQEWDDVTVVAAYDPAVLSELQAVLNVIQAMTIYYPDGTALTFWGFVRRIESSPLQKNTQPEITLTVVIANWDPNNCVEAGPVLVPGTGSCNPCLNDAIGT